MGMTDDVGRSLASNAEQRDVDERRCRFPIVARHVERRCDPRFLKVVRQIHKACRALGRCDLGGGISHPEHADHRANLLERIFRRLVRERHRLPCGGGIAIDQALGCCSLDTDRRKRVRRDVVDLASDADALLLDATSRHLLARALGLFGALLGGPHGIAMGAYGKPAERRDDHEHEVLHVYPEPQRSRGSAVRRRRKPQSARGAGDAHLDARAFHNNGEQSNHRPKDGEHRPMERVLQSDERHEREHEDKPRGFPARHEGKRRECKRDERRCGGNDGLDAEHAAQSLVGKDETCRDHQLHGAESKSGKRHRDVDRPIARAHFPIMYKHAVHAPIMRKPRTARHTPCGVSEQNQS